MNKYQDILTKLLTVFNGHWPPRAQFDNWPVEFVPYMEIADEIPEKLSISPTSEKFRTWMQNALEKVIYQFCFIFSYTNQINSGDCFECVSIKEIRTVQKVRKKQLDLVTSNHSVCVINICRN